MQTYVYIIHVCVYIDIFANTVHVLWIHTFVESTHIFYTQTNIHIYIFIFIYMYIYMLVL